MYRTISVHIQCIAAIEGASLRLPRGTSLLSDPMWHKDSTSSRTHSGVMVSKAHWAGEQLRHL